MLLILLPEQGMVLQNQGAHFVETWAARPPASQQHSSATRAVTPCCPPLPV